MIDKEELDYRKRLGTKVPGLVKLINKPFVANNETRKMSGWLEHCTVCKRRHWMQPALCAECGENDTVMPISDNVCPCTYRCDGCEEYQGRL